MNNLKGLKFDFSKVSKDQQIIKITEELGEVIQAIKGNGVIEDEIADLIIAVYGLSQVLQIDIDQAVQNKILMINQKYNGKK